MEKVPDARHSEGKLHGIGASEETTPESLQVRTKIAFLILAHDDPSHLARLCRALGSHDDIFVHLDKRTPLDLFDKHTFGANVKFVQQRVAVFWADISVVKATLRLLHEATESRTDYLRLVLLSGSCYPIKSVAQLREYFVETGDHIDIKYLNILEYRAATVPASSIGELLAPWMSTYKRLRTLSSYFGLFDFAIRKLIANKLAAVEVRVRGRFPRLTRYIGPLRARAKPWAISFHATFPELVPFVGSQFWAITPECADMILRFVQENPEFINFHRNSWAPDEHFFHTIIGNSVFSPKTNGEVRAEGVSLNNLHSPRFDCATMDDRDAVLASGAFFIRKVATGKSNELLDYLDEHVLSVGP